VNGIGEGLDLLVEKYTVVYMEAEQFQSVGSWDANQNPKMVATLRAAFGIHRPVILDFRVTSWESGSIPKIAFTRVHQERR
jgi:hypothetical protein